mgnify:CR=1 FL=1
MLETQEDRRAAWAEIREFLLLAVLFGVVFGLAIQPDDTMHPHIKPGDLLLYYRLPQRYTAGETVVFEKDGTRYTGRVAARGGDTVEVTDTALLLINGSVVAEPDIYEQTPRYDNGVQYPLTLADGEYFILCDARAGARDSRWFGPVRTGEIRGRVIALLRRSGI